MMRRVVPVAAATFMCLLALGTQVPAQPTKTRTPTDTVQAPTARSVAEADKESSSVGTSAHPSDVTAPESEAISADKPGQKSSADQIPEVHRTSDAAQEPPSESVEAAVKRVQAAGAEHQLRGRISYYGLAFKGLKTACGGRFDPKGLTMAHKTLPCGSVVKVTDLRNGKWVLVHVTDHGPNVRGRVADLSTAAAAQLGLLHRGVTEGQLEVMKFGAPGRGRRAH